MYLGLDIGTSSVKAVLIDEAQSRRRQPHGAARRVAPASRLVGAGPGELVDAPASATLDELAKRSPEGDRRGQGHRPLRPHARRDAARRRPTGRCAPASCGTTCARRRKPPSSTAIRASASITGNIVFPGFTAPKLVWVARHEPDIFAKVAKVLLPKDYVRLELTGDHASDMSDSAGTSWLDVARRDWSDELLAATGLSRAADAEALSKAPRRPASLRAELAKRWGMAAPPVVAGGGGDNAASACGVGVGPAGHRLRLARHLGRALRLQRPLLARSGDAPSMPSAMRCRTPGTRWA